MPEFLAGLERLADTFFNLDVLWRSLPALGRGLLNTLLLGATAIAVGSTLGLGLALVRLYAWRPLQVLAIVFIDVFRAVPTLVVIVVIYFALPFVGLRFSAFASASAALAMVLAAYTAEVCRAGIQAIPKGQFEAAAALGLHFVMAMRKVILPQALRVVTPPTTSNCISVIKETAVASYVAMPELLKQATDAQALNANPTPLIGAALIYLVVLWPLVRFAGWLERRSLSERARA